MFNKKTEEPIEVTKKFIEPDLNMSDGQLRAAVSAKERWILEKVKGTPQEEFEQEAIRLPLDASVGYANPLQQKRVHAILDQVGSGNKIVDIGGGDGYVAKLLTAQGNDVTVIDASEIRVLRCNYLNKIKALVGRADSIPLPDDSQDVVILAEILEHLPKMSVAIAEAERIVKKTGKIIITIPVHESHDGYPEHLHKIRTNDIDGNMLVLGISKIIPHYDAYLRQNRDKA
jgi:ubiquinone/menaquinone biosynthesis C-methylase UbiE